MTMQLTTNNNKWIPFLEEQLPRVMQPTSYDRNIVSQNGAERCLTTEYDPRGLAKITACMTGDLSYRDIQAAGTLDVDSQYERANSRVLKESRQIYRDTAQSGIQTREQHNAAYVELPPLKQDSSLSERNMCSGTPPPGSHLTYDSIDSLRVASRKAADPYPGKEKETDPMEYRLNKLVELKRSQPTAMQVFGDNLASCSKFPLNAVVGAGVMGGAYMVGDAFRSVDYTREKLDELGIEGPIGEVLRVLAGGGSLAGGALVGVGRGVYLGANQAYQSYQSGATIGQSIATSFKNAYHAATPPYILNGAGRLASDVGRVIFEAIKYPISAVGFVGASLIGLYGLGPTLGWVLGKSAALGWWATKGILWNAVGLAGRALRLA